MIVNQRKVVIEQLLEMLREEERQELLEGGQCPDKCARFKTSGICVHVLAKITPKRDMVNGHTKVFKDMTTEKQQKRIAAHKLNEDPCATWNVIERDEWKTLPFIYGVYVWVDRDDKIVYFAKATDFRRRHVSWSQMQDDFRWALTSKIWWLHTGWYIEIIEALMELPEGVTVTLDLLNAIKEKAHPFELPAAPEFS